MMKKFIQHQLATTLQRQFPQVSPSIVVTVGYTDNLQFGHLTSNIALQLASELKQSPRQIAQQLADQLQRGSGLDDKVARISIDGPGYLNFWLHSTSLWQASERYLTPIQHHPDKPGQGQRVMVEFSSPNIAKPFNVGHLRSTIIGESIARMHQYLGYAVLRDNHLGDWGTQYGKLAIAVELWGDWPTIEANPIPELFDLYVRFHQEEEQKPELTEQARAYFSRLEQGDQATRATWQRLVDLSLADFNQLYQQLGIKFDTTLSESFYEPMLLEIIRLAEDTGVAKESNGALLIFFDQPELKDHPLMIRKSDGSSTYATRDLAGIRYRLPTYQLDKLVIEIGNEQQLYFQQVIAAALKLQLAKPGQLVHVGHGLFLLPEGKMSTRRGQTIWLRDLIDELRQEALQIVQRKSDDLPAGQQQDIADMVAIGALKYNDLSQNRNSNIVFDKTKALNLDGNSAPYLQYTIARARSVLQRAEDQATSIEPQQLLTSTLEREQGLETAENELLAWLMRFDDIITQANDEYLPSTLATYLFQLAQRFNSFYQVHPILQTESKIQASRLSLTLATKHVLTKGLDLLGIETPDRM